MPRKTKLTKKEKIQEIKELKPKLSQEEANSLEQMVEGEEEKPDLAEIKEFIKGQSTEITPSSPSLKKINPPQRNPVRLEREIITQTTAINTANNDDEENGTLKYNLMDKKPDQEYHTINKEYNAMQREVIKQNPNVLVKQNEFIDPRKINLADSFPKRNFDIIADENLRDTKNAEKNYTFKQHFVEKDKRISRNPFEKKEIKYENF
jgi:hypothetical protein